VGIRVEGGIFGLGDFPDFVHQVSLLTGQKIQGLKINLSLYGNEIRELGNIGNPHFLNLSVF
jgi:hypothetical protein